MANRITLRLLKLLVDVTYYALPVLAWICKMIFYCLVGILAVLLIAIIL